MIATESALLSRGGKIPPSAHSRPSISPMHIRLVTPADADALLAIYNPEVIETVVTFDLVPGDTQDMVAWIESHQGAHPAIVAVADSDADAPEGAPRSANGDIILGYASIREFRDRPAYAPTVENSVYVARSARGRGVAKGLMDHLIAVATDAGFHSMIARIVGDNEGSLKLHKACGFELVGIEREVGRKHGRWLNVIEMQLLLGN